MSDANDNLSTGAIVGIIVGALVGLAGLIYLCYFRKHVNARQTQKLMDQTNFIHSQEPQGTMSPEILPDGSMGLLVRPLPAGAATSLNPSATTGPAGLSISMDATYSHPPAPAPSLPYSPAYMAPAPFSQASSSFACPWAPASTPFSPDLQQIRFSSHPRPGVVTTLSDELMNGEVIEEAKGDVIEHWEPRPFIPPARTSHTGSSFSASASGSGSASTSTTIPGIGTGIAAGMAGGAGGLEETPLTWSNSTPMPGTSPSFSASTDPHYSPPGAWNSAPVESTYIVRQERNPQDISPHHDASFSQSTATLIPPSTYSTPSLGQRKYPEMNPTMLPPRQLNSPHEPIAPPTSTSGQQDYYT